MTVMGSWQTVSKAVEAMLENKQIHKAEVQVHGHWSQSQYKTPEHGLGATLYAWFGDGERGEVVAQLWLKAEYVTSDLGEWTIKEYELNEEQAYFVVDHASRVLQGRVPIIRPLDPLEDDDAALPEPPEDARPFAAEEDDGDKRHRDAPLENLPF